MNTRDDIDAVHATTCALNDRLARALDGLDSFDRELLRAHLLAALSWHMASTGRGDDFARMVDQAAPSTRR